MSSRRPSEDPNVPSNIYVSNTLIRKLDIFGWFSIIGIWFHHRPEGVQVTVGGVSTWRGMQQDFSKHGEKDRDDLLWVVVTLSECCGDLLLVQQTWQDRLDTNIPQWNTNTQSWCSRTSSPLLVGLEL